MGRILRHVVDDIQTALKQNFDDQEFTDTQVAYWVITIGDRLRAQHIGKRRSGAFLTTYSGIPVRTFTNPVNPNQIPNRKYVELPECIYDFDLDAGVKYISYWDTDDECGSEYWRKRKFLRTDPTEVEVLEYSPYTKPSPSNPYFYRVGDYLYLLGIECVDIESVEIGIYQILPDVTTVDIDAVFEFPAELLHVLRMQVLNLARFGLQIPDEGKVNTGSDNSTSENIPTEKIVSVNDPVNSSEGS
jgi:hypothetical protein